MPSSWTSYYANQLHNNTPTHTGEKNVPFQKLHEISQTKQEHRTFEIDDSLPLPANKVGIEIELENVSDSTFDKICRTGYWKFHEEGSLRGECGEIASIPIFGKDIDRALEVLPATFRRIKKPEFNQRTSTHIHVDVVDMTKEELIRFFLLYTAMEHLLFRLCDSSRQNNPYCLANYSSEGTKRQLAHLIEKIESEDRANVKWAISRWEKYCAMNLQNIIGIGTIEFRHMHGTINPQEIKDWIRILLSLKKYAVDGMSKYNDFPEVVSGFSPLEYLRKIFSEDLVEKLYHPHLAEDLLRGVRCAQDILLYRRLGRATKIIYEKQTHKDKTSFHRITGIELPVKKSSGKTRSSITSSIPVPELSLESLEETFYEDDEEF